MNQNLHVKLYKNEQEYIEASSYFEIHNCNINHFHISTPQYSLLSGFSHTLLDGTKTNFKEKNKSFQETKFFLKKCYSLMYIFLKP